MMHFSIIIATHNASKYLERCLNSIRNQTYQNFELIIIDANSKDNTLNIIKSNLEFINYYISEDDNGIYDAWNKGILKSNGKWVLMLGSDDILFTNALEFYYNYSINFPNLDFISAKLNLVTQNGNIITTIGEKWEWGKFKFKMNCIHVSSLHNRNLFQEIGLFNNKYKISGDYEFLLRKKHNLKVGFLNQIVGNMQEGGISNSYKSLFEILKAKKLHNLNIIQIYISFFYLYIYLFLHNKLKLINK
jgi:glycosyltransferase involved in cell wall biosynthesis